MTVQTPPPQCRGLRGETRAAHAYEIANSLVESPAPEEPARPSSHSFRMKTLVPGSSTIRADNVPPWTVRMAELFSSWSGNASKSCRLSVFANSVAEANVAGEEQETVATSVSMTSLKSAETVYGDSGRASIATGVRGNASVVFTGLVAGLVTNTF